MDKYSDFFENNRLKSEYSLGRYISSFLFENNQGCDFCDSFNLEISEIEFDGIKSKITRDIDQFQLVISKHENGKIEIETGGSINLPYEFLNEAFKLIEDSVISTNENYFEEKHIGNIRFIVSTGYLGNNHFRTNRLEHFSFVGFRKDALEDYAKQIKLQMLDSNKFG
jgi:thioredoxin-related protein